MPVYQSSQDRLIRNLVFWIRLILLNINQLYATIVGSSPTVLSLYHLWIILLVLDPLAQPPQSAPLVRIGIILSSSTTRGERYSCERPTSKKVVSREAFIFWRLALKYYRQKS